MSRVLIVLSLFLLPTVSSAQSDNETKPKVKYQPRTEIDFETLDVVGTLEKPALTQVNGRVPQQHPIFITLRTNFTPEMTASTRQMQ